MDWTHQNYYYFDGGADCDGYDVAFAGTGDVWMLKMMTTMMTK